MKRKSFAAAVCVSAVAAGMLSGCETYSSVASYITSDKATSCPDAAVLVGTATLPAFDPSKGSDPSNVVYTARMIDVSTRCSFNKHDDTADARVNVHIQATRPPGGRGETYRVPYFVAVSTGSDVVAKQLHWTEVHFAPGAATAEADGTVDSVIVTVAKGKQVYDYHLLTGFQLTQAQLDYNAKMGRYAP